MTGLVREAIAAGARRQSQLGGGRSDEVAGQATVAWRTVGAWAAQDTKWSSSDPGTNKALRNFGTMLDFFDYSGVVV